MDKLDVLFNKRQFLLDEFSEAYKGYDKVVKTVVIYGMTKRSRQVFVAVCN